MPDTTVRVAVEIRDDHGTWQRAITVPTNLTADAPSGAMHQQASEVMDSCYVDWSDDQHGEPVTRRHGRPVRALVLTDDTDTDRDALWVWGGACALPA